MWLETERLHLRDFVAGDWPDVYAYSSDPDVVRYLPFGPSSVEQTKEHIARCIALARAHPRHVYDMAVVLRAEQRVIGSCTLALLEYEPRHATFAYLFHRAYWGHGYATEAMRALFTYGFETLGLHRIADTCDARNIASVRVMEKLGMRREAHYRETIWDGTAWHDEYGYAILAHEWRARGQHNVHTGVRQGINDSQ
ncbi:MAG: GNAT family N-acetyltransferase [Chloroflexi bacterium]|nr:GNAT family N-acetyltransferase [Chloroflexota bacterium]